jgi:hypothetical protein
MYCNTEKDYKKIMRKLAKNNKFFIGNFFECRKDRSTGFIFKRKQFSHIVSESLLEYLGYSLDEFSEVFMTYGFPKIYNNITDIYTIINMYKRDIFTNQKLKN